MKDGRITRRRFLGGAAAVAAFTAEPLAVACGIAPSAATSLLADALDLHHRLPVLWDHTVAGLVPAWKARRVAVRTRHLPLDAAKWLDRQIAAYRRGQQGEDRVVDAIRSSLDAQWTLFRNVVLPGRNRADIDAVLVGPPNAGKSSLLNALAGSERAIVTEIPGTTRDLLHETLRIDGVELTLADTAGLRGDGDAIEREGMRRARAELARADLAVVVLDARDPDAGLRALEGALDGAPEAIVLHNKSDLLAPDQPPAQDALRVSARTGTGLDALHARLHAAAAAIAPGEGAVSARARHVDALQRSAGACAEAAQALDADQLDLAAEALRLAHDALGEITGRVLPDDLLGHIFSTFCVGK